MTPLVLAQALSATMIATAPDWPPRVVVEPPAEARPMPQTFQMIGPGHYVEHRPTAIHNARLHLANMRRLREQLELRQCEGEVGLDGRIELYRRVERMCEDTLCRMMQN